MKKYKVAILGATGLVGQKMLKILEERNFPIESIKLTASARSVGKKIKFRGEELTVIEATPDAFNDVEIVLSSAGGAVSKELAPEIVKRGGIIIDNTSAFRMFDYVPLVVPEVNPEALRNHKGIIANPNCSTIQLVVALKPLNDYVPIKRVLVSTYQAVSGAGTKAIDELYSQSKAILEGNFQKPEKTVLPQVIGFNVIPHGGKFLDNDYTEEEVKITNETRKILGVEDLAVSATCIRVPVVTSHSEVVNIEFERELAVDKIRELLRIAEGVKVLDNPDNHLYPMPIDVTGKDDVYVGRIRKDLSHPNAINMWIVGDNIRKGAALNAVQIAEKMIQMNLI